MAKINARYISQHTNKYDQEKYSKDVFQNSKTEISNISDL